jgi:hypothetical protein
MLRVTVLALAALCCLGGVSPAHAFGKKKSVTVDSVIEPVIAGDATGIVEGCGLQPIVGYTYCRVVEGDATNQNISFIGPPAQCNDPNACVFVKVFDRNGQIAWGGQIPKGQTRVTVPWKSLVGADQFQQLQKGDWTAVIEVHWIDPDNHDRVSRTQVDISLRVYKKGYIPLDKVAGDPNFVWQWVDGKYSYKMTSGLRAYVGVIP